MEVSEEDVRVGGKNRIRKWAFRVAVALALAAASIYFWPKIVYSLSHESTDDAYIQGTIIPVSPEVKGKVKAVLVEDNQPVRKGDPLLEIDSDEYARVVTAKQDALERALAAEKSLAAAMDEKSWELKQAEARFDGARADLDYARTEEARYKRLLNKESVSRSKYDKIGSQRKVKEAEAEARRAEVMAARMAIRTLRAKLGEQKRAIQEARSLLELARIDLARTIIRAPASGNVTRKNIYPGNYVQPGQPLLAIVDPSEVWIVANFKETQVEKMQVGQPVDIRVDAYPGIVFKGRVDSFQHGTGSVFSLLPPNNATGSFVKVVQRVPVKIALDGPPDPRYPLWPGLSVVPHVDVGAKAVGISG